MHIIGAEEDLFFQLPDVRPVLVTSIVKDPSVELSYLILTASQGEMLNGPFASQIIYTPLQNLHKQTPSDIETRFEEIYDALREGIIDINLPEKD